MASTFKSGRGALNGVAAVTLLGAPASGQRATRPGSIVFFNRDTILHNIIVRVDVSGTDRYVFKLAVAPNTAGSVPVIIVLDNAIDFIEAIMEEAIATQNPDYNVGYLEMT